jgi:hypothetical protein
MTIGRRHPTGSPRPGRGLLGAGVMLALMLVTPTAGLAKSTPGRPAFIPGVTDMRYTPKPQRPTVRTPTVSRPAPRLPTPPVGSAAAALAKGRTESHRRAEAKPPAPRRVDPGVLRRFENAQWEKQQRAKDRAEAKAAAAAKAEATRRAEAKADAARETRRFREQARQAWPVSRPMPTRTPTVSKPAPRRPAFIPGVTDMRYTPRRPAFIPGVTDMRYTPKPQRPTVSKPARSAPSYGGLDPSYRVLDPSPFTGPRRPFSPLDPLGPLSPIEREIVRKIADATDRLVSRVRSPDYGSLTVNGPLLSTQVGIDRYGRPYVGGGVSVGVPSASLLAGYKTQGDTPSRDEMDGFMSGLSRNIGGGGYWVGGGVTEVPGSGHGIELGLSTPGVGASAHYSIQVGESPWDLLLPR